jgi:ABC-type transport system involved in multi-copper enzyme maturation permease subunit/ABC-type uncharacterized transport system involved in gliding motility auxiliary subunit
MVKKELRQYFSTPSAYIILVVFLLLWEFLYFRIAFVIGYASLEPLFYFLPWLLLLLVPAITMGAISQEKSEGTIELLLTHPVKEREVVVGKFVAACLFVVCALLFIFPVALALDHYGNVDWGVIAGQYVAGVLLASVFAAVGIAVSAFFASQISALLVTVAANFILVVLGFEMVTAHIPLSIIPFIERLSVLSHFESLSRGVIDLRDLWYFISVIVIFLSLAHIVLLKRKFGNRRARYSMYTLATVVFIMVAVFSNMIGDRIPGRLDLTEGKMYTLSDATKKIVSELPETATVTLYASAELPSQVQPLLREVKDVLKDYQTFGKGKIFVAFKNPAGDIGVTEEMNKFNIQEVQFNVIGEGEYQVKKGYFGIGVLYKDKRESIPYIQDTGDLEYQLTSFIRQMSAASKKKIGFVSGLGTKNPYENYQLFGGELSKQFDLEQIDLTVPDALIQKKPDVLVLAGSDVILGEKEKAQVKEYLDKGGAAMVMADAVSIDEQTLFISESKETISDFLKEYGVSVDRKVLYDLKSNETIRFGDGPISYLLPYPFWARVFAVNNKVPPVLKINTIVMPWASPLHTDANVAQEKGLTITELFKTSKDGGAQDANFAALPSNEFSKDHLGVSTAAVSIVGQKPAEGAQGALRMVIVGDSDFLSDNYISESAENLSFGMEAFSWLGQEDSLASIRLKQAVERNLFFENSSQMSMVEYGNMALILLIPGVGGAVVLWRRRSLRKKEYQVR